MKDIFNQLELSHFDFEFKEVQNEPFDISIHKSLNKVVIKYRRKHHLIRALGIVKINEDKDYFDIEEKCSFENLSYLIDVARDSVPTIKTLKKQAFNLALLGYSQIYLYLEDLLEVDNEPYFGHFRGRYSKEEIKELDKYCLSLGIELIPAIQTLAHFNAIFDWPDYYSIHDIDDILLVGSKRVDTLIENIFKTVSECFATKTIHIGMDEAHKIGRGRYFEEHGYEKPFDILYKQLLKVIEIAKPYGYHLQMWSDMFFRIAFNRYYVKEGTIPKEILDKVPEGIDLVYWDYYNVDKTLLKNMFRNHKLFKGETYFALGAWKWNGWAPSNHFSIYNMKIQLEECKKQGINNIMLTAWGDDGGEASIYSTLPTVVYLSEKAYSNDVSLKHLNDVSKKLLGFNYKEFLDSDLILLKKEESLLNTSYFNYGHLQKVLFYNDLLSGLFDGAIKGRFSFDHLSKLTKKMRRYSKSNPEYSLYFKNLENLSSVLEIKAKLGIELREAYQLKDKVLLNKYANKVIPNLIKRVERFFNSFYEQWMIENKSNGFAVHSIRIGGLIERLKITRNLLNDYLNDKKEIIEELEVKLLPMKDEEALPYIFWINWNKIFSPGVK